MMGKRRMVVTLRRNENNKSFGKLVPNRFSE